MSVAVAVGVGVAVGEAVVTGDGVGDGVGSGVGDCVGDGVGSGVVDGVGSGVGIGAGVGDGPVSNVTWTVAPAADMATVVMEIRLTGSTRVWPADRGASRKLVVDGFASTSCDWVGTEYPDVIRTLTPVTAGAVVANVSKGSDGPRSSSIKNELDVRAIRNARTTLVPGVSVASSA